MNEKIIVQYLGFEAKPQVREYTFLVRETAIEPREFTLTIVNEAFDGHRVRFQDAPDICSLRLHNELAAFANRPPKSHFRISETDLDEYRSAHTSNSTRSLYPRKPAL